jgi:hypothetical protein
VLVVVSTGLNAPAKPKCLASVASQKGVPFRHVYIEAGDQVPRLSMTENVHRAIYACDPLDIVVCVDGDDWLPHDDVLRKVQAMHDAGAWVTYGSFVFADEPGYDRSAWWPGKRTDIVYVHDGPTYKTRPAYPRHAYASTAYRLEPWLASHLKTFRAFLYQAIAEEDLRIPEPGVPGWGDWSFCNDHAIMFPMLEMAGPDRVMHCKDLMYVYNWAVSCERAGTPEEQARSAAHAAACRKKTPYAKLP